jgi:hypothetical protein
MHKYLVLAALAAPAVLLAAMPAAAKDRRTVLACANVGAVDISMQARSVVRVKGTAVRHQFKVEFEAAPRIPGFAAGQVLSFTVAGVPVGTRALKTAPDGDLVAELELDSRKRGANAFPAGFPALAAGALVEVGRGGTAVLSCALK